jgi:Flp pilus assembly secretin CpaC
VQATRNTSNGSDALDISTQLEVIPGEDKLMFAKEAFYAWGITLTVKPRISPDGLISVEIVPTISQLDTDVTSTGFYQVSGGDSSAYSSYPIIQVKRLTTDFTMKDGATAVIGGLSKTTEGDVDSGIPYLRKIPWIGPKLFGWKSRSKIQKEIIVFVTLGVADPADLATDVGLPKNAIVGREYVNGRKFEPGDRAGGLADVMSLDTRTIEEKQADNTRGSGTVKITPVNEPDK